MGSLFQFVCPQIHFLAMKSMARSVYDTFTGFYEFLLFSLKHTPPNNIWVFAVLVRRKAMKCASHIVQRQHTVFTFYILNYGTPMFMIIELCTQNFKTKTESSCFFIDLIYNQYLTSTNLILVIDKTCQDMTAICKAVVVILQVGTKLSFFHIFFELYPNGIVCIVEECGWSLFPLFYVYLMVGIKSPLYRHDTFRPKVSGVELVLAYISLSLVPNAIELRAFDNHCEILMLNSQQFHLYCF